MPWAAAAGVVSAAGSYAASSSAASKGAAAAQQAIGLQQQNADENVSRNAPWLQAGNEGVATLRDLQNRFQIAPTASDVMATPGYQFQKQEGVNTVQQGAAATSGNLSGAALKALDKYGTNFATTKYNDTFQQMRQQQGDQWGRAMGMANMGQQAASIDAGIGTHAADASGSIGTNAASYSGAAGIVGSNAIGSALSQVGAAGAATPWTSYPDWLRGAAGTAGAQLDGSYNPNYGNEGNRVVPPSAVGNGWADGGPVTRNRMRYLADGGPVRSEPVVGSRSPVRTGGGGGLSDNAIRDLLAQRMVAARMAPMGAASAPMMGASAPMGMGALPGNPLTDPGAILRARLQAAGEFATGGPVHGPGGPRDDMIPARLSDGEHVMDAATVNAIGGGDNAHGQMKLNRLRAMLKQHAGA